MILLLLSACGGHRVRPMDDLPPLEREGLAPVTPTHRFTCVLVSPPRRSSFSDELQRSISAVR